ncbi:MAG: cytochrome b/b6 domain-containing protein [Bryobacterales bacterium]|nr:cytochrome b/b6 domain-containing protein [Bryobacterales bacterium]
MFRILAVTIAGLLFSTAGVPAQQVKPLPGSDECAACHDAGRRGARREAGVPPNFDAAALRASPHAELECNGCHADLAVKKEFPHPEKLAPVDCGGCHPDQQAQYDQSLHGTALKKGDRSAPSCKTCHGAHDVLRRTAPNSPIATMGVPRLCGQCHREGSPVSLTHAIPQSNILGNYTDSIHGEGLFRRGLVVTAVCTSCHTSHFVLPHTDPRSSIAKANIARTCTQCHARIEDVHQKVIRGELWEKQPNLIPACVDCHQPHQVRRVFYTEGMADRDCQRCHGNPALKSADGRAMYVNQEQVQRSRHARTACVQCHTGASPSLDRPCKTAAPKVDCSICHADQVAQYNEGIHGQLVAKGSPDGPACADCHGTHGVRGRNESDSPTFSRNVPNLCARCHRSGQKAALRYTGKQVNVVERYVESIHGKGLLESGLTVTANCADCHTAHRELPASDPRSSVNRRNVAQTCGQCHRGIFEQFDASVHSARAYPTSKPLPECSDCHSSHSIARTDLASFQLNTMDQCGRCHEAITRSYFDTYHGKVSRLGSLKTARCSDCHGAHDVLPVADPRSRLSRANIVATCAKCHPGSHRRFAGYLTHATHHDPSRYPFLFWTFWGMTTLLLGTLTVSGLHTVAWLPRSLQYRKQLRALHAGGGEVYVRRFEPFQRNLHLLVIFSFFGLALTGMMLKFSYAAWAQVMSRLFGGFEAAGWIHRFCALITFLYFGLHVFDLVRRKRRSGRTWRQFIFDREGMMFGRQDWRELVGSVKWFLGKGPRPEYGRWTYWEKFDYFAVFWGVFVIGSTGLLLWFPQLFTRLMPGWMINVATTIHSDEALLAVGFIFTIHFFNTHFRPERFPMDTVIFTGGVPLEEFKRDRPREYQQAVESGQLESMLMAPPEPLAVKLWKRLGFAALAVGLLLIALIIYAQLIVYR